MGQNPLGVLYVQNNGTLIPAAGDANGNIVTDTGPSSAAADGIVPVVTTGTVLTDSLIVKASAGNFYGGSVTNAGTAGLYAMVINSATLPANGTLSTGQILDVDYVGTLSTLWFGPYTPPEHYSNGITMATSSSAPPVLTAAGTCFFKGRGV